MYQMHKQSDLIKHCNEFQAVPILINECVREKKSLIRNRPHLPATEMKTTSESETETGLLPGLTRNLSNLT